jgi:hypothetical protein
MEPIIDPKLAEGKNEFEVETLEMDKIADEARKEIAGEKVEKPAEKKEEKEEKAEDGQETEEDKAAKVKADEDKVKAKEAKEIAKKKEEEDALIAKDDKDLDEDERYKKIAITKIREDDKKKTEDEAIKVFADKHKLPIDKAREELDHITKIKEKYKDDDRELPLAYLNIQRQNTKLSDDLKRVQEAAPIKSIEKLSDEDIVAEFVDGGKITEKGKSIPRERVLELYRLKHPKQTDNQEDDVVASMLAKDIRQGLVMQRTTQIQDSKIKAKDKRAEIISSIEEKDKEFSDIVKEVVNNHSDEAILSDSFSVQDVIRWAKGEKYDDLVSKHTDEIKKAHDEGFRKGKENAKILGTKETVTPKESSKGSKTVTLTEAQKKEALDMFDLPSMTDDEKYESYIDVKKLKEKK